MKFLVTMFFVLFCFVLFCFIVVAQETDSVKGIVKLRKDQYQYHPDYTNHSSERYKELSRNFVENVSL